jgi:hypothetical protein
MSKAKGKCVPISAPHLQHTELISSTISALQRLLDAGIHLEPYIGGRWVPGVTKWRFFKEANSSPMDQPTGTFSNHVSQLHDTKDPCRTLTKGPVSAETSEAIASQLLAFGSRFVPSPTTSSPVLEDCQGASKKRNRIEVPSPAFGHAHPCSHHGPAFNQPNDMSGLCDLPNAKRHHVVRAHIDSRAS